MKTFLEEYGMMISALIVAVVLMGAMFTFGIDSIGLSKFVPDVDGAVNSNNQNFISKKPVLNVAKQFYFKTLPKGTDLTTNMFDSFIQSAENYEGEDLRGQVEIEGIDRIDPSVAGTHVIIFQLEDNGIKVKKQSVVLFNDKYQGYSN